MRGRKAIIGSFFAISASIVNGSVGVFVKNLFQMDFDYYQASFYKCVVAFFILYFICMSNAKMRREFRELLRNPVPIAICAFLGLFVLYFFETCAYQYMKVSEVVLLLMVGSVITSAILSAILLKDKLGITSIGALILALIGIFLLTDIGGEVSVQGCMIAFMSGVGYGGYLVLSRLFKMKATVPFLCLLLLFGCLFLMIPFLLYSDPVIPSSGGLADILILAIFPTILGFYFTTKALEYISSNKAQLMELSEPVFALIFSMIFLGEFLTKLQLVAMVLIIFALYLAESQIVKNILDKFKCFCYK
ncbi:DMT family transporter [Pseudofrancisella aestuarii]|uniref:DMT family transporter n=1 Tax=Pseudofrancisella aestuarii TaxID=2670347 RepID=A0ABV9TBK9_9GAMM|nr:DMT family transporter [Pseudofrancisella aestuarii]